MKKCILVHVNDGEPEILRNDDRMFIEHFMRAEKVIEDYISQGYEVKQIIPDYEPSVQETGNFTFYKSGMIIYFEKDE